LQPGAPAVLRISKLTDYGTVILADLAELPGAGDQRIDERALASAADVAVRTGLGLPTVQKLLKMLAKSGLVEARRGAQGGYRLARRADDISAADVIDALEGPVSITDCSIADRHCEIEANCTVGSAWQRINVAIRRALSDISLADLQTSNARVSRFNFAGTPIHVETKD
jgi:FeS assembly SUF system regulator